MQDQLLNEGSVHGRFQPFHNGHLEYVLEAQRRCRFLWIGITKYDIDTSELSPLGRSREKPENNPLTFHERLTMIGEALVAQGIRREAFAFIPFPIEKPAKLPQFLPVSVPCFTTIYEEWNREKIQVLKSHGYDVIVLWERERKEISGGEIRDDMLSGGTRWKGMVPPTTVKLAQEFVLQERLKKLRESV
jgi:nicotinamide mononucleotide adenylyltransferase